MAKVLPVTKQDGTIEGYMFECPGCGDSHEIFTSRDGAPKWQFNGDLNKPTVSPSLLCRGFVYDKDKNGDVFNTGKKYVCHSFIRDGKIQFLDDCTHNLKGQTVDLSDVEGQ